MFNGWKLTKFNAIKSIISLVLIIGLLIWRKHDRTTGAQLVLDGIKEDEFYGRVDSVFRDARDHNIQKVKLTTGYQYGLYPEWESIVEKGDSLSKPKGSVIVVVFKKNGTKVNFDYRELVKDWKD
ncbi:hypothetical protein LLH06_05400 [Mucilaginibacter daejeonensis]|uniref:hypothetical protein n=1 Tax=Mucilaginibacter daejeonensis TaxID=398049 RepID=UPI001D178904|nr:hypothetical protein [Mucilaginibacter daejeonensis]UEG54400.1 hypothetical protein LLH06_05400 [Mucilaginibacter daejeonensis]